MEQNQKHEIALMRYSVISPLITDLQEQIRFLKVNYPRMSAAAIYRQLQDNGSIRQRELSESTINRYINQLATAFSKTPAHQTKPSN